MKYTIEGFSQKRLIELNEQYGIKLDCIDIVILRWFVDFFPNMNKVEVNGNSYAWLTHSKLVADLPIISISKRAFSERLRKWVACEVLEYQIVKEGGTFSYYRFGKNYESIVSERTGVLSERIGVCSSNDIGYVVETTYKDTSIKDTSISNNKKKYKRKSFEPPTREEVRDYVSEKGLLIDADEFYDYYDVGDWKDVGGNGVKNWKQKAITWSNREKKNGTANTRDTEDFDTTYTDIIFGENS